MSLHYLLDGYNILHQIPKLIHLELDQQRMALVRDIENARPQGSLNNKVTLVFDGRRGRAEPIQSVMVDIIYTLDDTADDRIIRMVQQTSNSKNFIVVTDDRAVQYRARAEGAQICSVKDFLKRLNTAKTKGPSFSKTMNQNVIDQINEELKARWLNKKDPEEKNNID